MIPDGIPLGDTYSSKIAIEQLLCTSTWVSVLWGTQKIQQKRGLHIIFACSGAMLLRPEFFLIAFPCPAEPMGIRAGMEGCRAVLPSYKIWGHLAALAKSRAQIKVGFG